MPPAVKAAFRAMPVTIPGNAIGRITSRLIACRPTLDHPGRLLPTLARDPDWLR